jgi:hypothetical protein
MAEVATLDLINRLRVIPSFEKPVVFYLGSLLDATRRTTTPDGVVLWVKDPVKAAPPLVSKVVAAYADRPNPFDGWVKPDVTDPPRFQIYWGVVRLMELEPNRWPGLINPIFRVQKTEFEPPSRPKRVWFGAEKP